MVLTIILAWVAVSLPLGVIVGRIIDAGSRREQDGVRFYPDAACVSRRTPSGLATGTDLGSRAMICTRLPLGRRAMWSWPGGGDLIEALRLRGLDLLRLLHLRSPFDYPVSSTDSSLCSASASISVSGRATGASRPVHSGRRAAASPR